MGHARTDEAAPGRRRYSGALTGRVTVGICRSSSGVPLRAPSADPKSRMRREYPSGARKGRHYEHANGVRSAVLSQESREPIR
jgi:hypothetical protein